MRKLLSLLVITAFSAVVSSPTPYIPAPDYSQLTNLVLPVTQGYPVVVHTPKNIEVDWDYTRGVPVRYLPMVRRVSAKTGVHPVILCAVVDGESGWNSRAVNSNRNGTRDYGLAQHNSRYLSWFAQKFYPGYNVWNPEQNLEVSAMYIRWITDQVGTDLRLVFSAYNCGVNAVLSRKIPASTKRYADRAVNYVLDRTVLRY